MATTPRKKRFSLFGTQQNNSVNTLNTGSSLLTNYFPTTTSITSIRDDKFLTSDDIKKSMEIFERIVLSANDYCDSIDKLGKTSKTFSKALKEYGNIKGMDASHVTSFQATSQFFEIYAEIQLKLNKVVQKEFETLQKFWDKYSKKATKEERAHNDYISDLDRQLNKVTLEYEKKAKKTFPDSHEKYINSVTLVNSDIARARAEYVTQLSKRERNTHDIIAQIICRIIENQNNSFNDSSKRCGPSVTKINETLPLVGVCTQSSHTSHNNNDDDNGDESKISKPVKPTKEISMITRKLSRKASHKVSQSFATISELQAAAMNYFSSEFNKPLYEEPEEEEISKSSLPPQIPPVSISTEPMDLRFNHPIQSFDEIIKSENNFNLENNNNNNNNNNLENNNNNNNNKNENSYNDNEGSSILSIPLSFKQKTSELISKISIGIHDEDYPFIRDYDIIGGENKSIKSNEIINNNNNNNNNNSPQENKEIKNLSINTGNNFLNNDSNITNNIIEKATKKNKENEINNDDDDDDDDDDGLKPAYSFDTRYLVCSFPTELPTRISPSTSPRESINFENNNNNSRRKTSEESDERKEFEQRKKNHLQHTHTRSDGNIKYEKVSKSNSSTNSYQFGHSHSPTSITPITPITPATTTSSTSNCEDYFNSKSRFSQLPPPSSSSSSSSSLLPPPPLSSSSKSNNIENEKSSTRLPTNLRPRRANTDYNLLIKNNNNNNSKRVGPSVADLKERFLSLNNDNNNNNNNKEKTPSTPRSIPRSKQGHVSTLLSRFDIENPHHPTRSTSQTSKASEDYFFRNITKRSSEDYSYNNNRYEEDIVERSHSSTGIFKDEMYHQEPLSNENVFSSSPTKQEECNCHNCRQIAEKVDLSLDPLNDSSTFGRKSIENNGNI
ncbi:hypothetical protein Glove_99g318 [Diversispora epigaea]|uniref:BAR domain-containing protein n=1 Tax=Diversispora epigaea TaxID=1348612 RepID=A0A397JF09_9GLOM|nr:hypothetical protein Glove_99g318 [Diversispora epigaea]